MLKSCRIKVEEFFNVCVLYSVMLRSIWKLASQTALIVYNPRFILFTVGDVWQVINVLFAMLKTFVSGEMRSVVCDQLGHTEATAISVGRNAGVCVNKHD